MDYKKYDEFLQTLSFFEENAIPLDLINEQINLNYFDDDGNNYLHYLANYSFKEYCNSNCYPNNNEIIKESKYNSLLKKYLEKISFYINVLNKSNCDFFSININNEIPLDSCLIKQNYYIANLYLKNQKTNVEYLSNLKHSHILFSLGNCMDEEYIICLLNIFDNKDNKSEKNLINNSPLISICKDYNQNIYNKFKQLLRINCVEYLQEDKKGTYLISSNEETKKIIKEKTINDLNKFCSSYFFKLINTLTNDGFDINFIENNSSNNISIFMYLMAYPMFPNVLDFITKNKININYKDNLGRTALIHLINNKKNIIKISKNLYDEVFHALINHNSINLSLRDNNGISAFFLCLINDYFDDAKDIYNKNNKLMSEYKLDILFTLFIKINQNKFNLKLLSNISDKFKSIFSINNCDTINRRTLLHYYFMFNSNSFNDFKNTLGILIKMVKDCNLKDIYNRNCIFYLFIDCYGDSKQIEDPYKQLELCLGINLFKIDINENDIFGNNLVFYVIKGGFIESLKFLIKYGAYLEKPAINNTRNSIYSTSIMVNDKIFVYLYNLQKVSNIIEQKCYKIYENYEIFENSKKKNTINNNNNEFNIGLNMYDFFHNPELIIDNGYEIGIGNKIIFKNESEIINTQEEKENEHSPNICENIFTLLNLLSKENLNIINNFIKKNLYFEFENPTKSIKMKLNNRSIANMKEIIQNPNKFINIILNQSQIVIANNLNEYCISYKNSTIDNILNPKEEKQEINQIKKCKKLIEMKDFKKLIVLLKEIITKNKDKKLFEINDKDESNIFHILAITIFKEEEKDINYIYNELKKYKINNLYDSKGNTPMYYACQKLNKKFIETFSNFIFQNQRNENINTTLFIESKSNNGNTPLEELYKNLYLEDDNLLRLIIEVTLKEKKGYILYVIKFLINKYNSSYINTFKQTYKNMISSPNYFIRIIGLYQYLTNDLQYNLKVKDEDGYDPFILSATEISLIFYLIYY